MGYFRASFVSQPGALSFTVTNYGSGIVSDPFPYPSTSPAALALCANPSPTTVFAGSSFSFVVQPSEVNITGNVAVTLASLPAGITTTTNSVAVPPGGVAVHFAAANNTTAGSYDLAFNGSVGSTTAKGDFNFTVSTGTPPAFDFARPLQTEVGVPIGGSGSIQFSTIVNSTSSVDFDITPSVTGLPAGTTATFSPSVFQVGQNVTVKLTAANSAPVTQNALVTLTGTPAAQTAAATSNFFADVTQPPGSLPGNRTDFVSTAGTPYAAAYDSTHNLIFSSNPSWNRVDVISNATHKVVKSIPVRSPRSLDITQDNAHVWVQTASPDLYSIDTSTFHSTHYSLPDRNFTNSSLPVSFAADRLLALSDGTLFVFFLDGATNAAVGIWNPQTNQLRVFSIGNSGISSPWGFPVRSGDGTRVYAANTLSNMGVQVYDVASQSVSVIGSGTRVRNLGVAAVNHDGSKLILGGNNLTLYDSNLSSLGSLPGTLPSGGGFPLNGGVLFSADNTRIYENVFYDGLVVVVTIDSSNLQVLGTAPSGIIQPLLTSGAAGAAVPFAIDSTGMLLGVQNYGISFDDATFFQHYATANQPGQNGTSVVGDTYAGPLAGGTSFSLYIFPPLTPDVWFGQTRGTASISQQQVRLISPPGTTPGPVNVKLIYPDGTQTFDPLLFSYSAFPEYAVTSGSSPNGGAPGRLLGTGLPTDSSGGTLKIGPNTAAITPPPTQNIPFSGEPYPSTILSYTFPPGSPGLTDLQVITPIGTGTLPKAILYAKTVTDYSSTDAFTAALVDEKRKQVYVSAGDHVDVFSTVSNQFVTSLHPAALGTSKQFTGLALTPDGSQLLVGDLLDYSLAVINPDSPSSSFAIAIPPGLVINNCANGPLYVAAASANLAYVSLGGVPSCPNEEGFVYVVNLQSRGVALAACYSGIVDAPSDGSFIVTEYGGSSLCIQPPQNTSPTVSTFLTIVGGIGVAASGDGNVITSDLTFYDTNANRLGAVAHPIPLYGNPFTAAGPPSPLLRPRLNASGSLFYLSYPNYFEIIDVLHATLRMRFSLTETISNAVAPLAIDSGGRFVYLLTDKGLTVVDLGAAPLSIGHLTPQSAAAGAHIIVRGSGFASGLTATVGGVAASVSVTDENTLTLTLPAAAAGPQDIVLTRADGEIYTLENGVTLQ